MDFKAKIFEYIRHFFSIAGALVLVVIAGEIYVPINPLNKEPIVYSVKKGMGDDEIAKDLQEMKIIKSDLFFKAYVFLTFRHSKLQAGNYLFSQSMSLWKIVHKLVMGDIITQKVTIKEGWDLIDIKDSLDENKIQAMEDFNSLSAEDYSADFDFLKDKPKTASIEGYIYPDTYRLSTSDAAKDLFEKALFNFGQKLTPEIRQAIEKQKKSIYEIVTVASLIEKEVKTMDDKKIVSGIIWKRLEIGMPLQMDSTVNYITQKNDPGASFKDIAIDSPYNTYKYKGLPKGPISNPGIESIMAAIYPKASPYLFYLSTRAGKTIFSRTLAEQEAARRKYLK